MRHGQNQRNANNNQKIETARGHSWRDTAVVAFLIGAAALVTWTQPAVSEGLTLQNAHHADWVDDIIDIIDGILGGGSSGSGDGSGGDGSGGDGSGTP